MYLTLKCIDIKEEALRFIEQQTEHKVLLQTDHSQASQAWRRTGKKKWEIRGDTTFSKGTENLTALKIPIECPLTLSIKVGWSKTRALGSEKGKVIRSRLLWVRSRGETSSTWYT